MEKFYTNVHKLLRFWALWDSRCDEPCGTLRHFILHYFLEDDTIEIKEYDPKKRYQTHGQFLSRGKLLKARQFDTFWEKSHPNRIGLVYQSIAIAALIDDFAVFCILFLGNFRPSVNSIRYEIFQIQFSVLWV